MIDDTRKIEHMKNLIDKLNHAETEAEITKDVSIFLSNFLYLYINNLSNILIFFKIR